MRKLLFGSFFCLLVVSQAHGMSSVSVVTPTNAAAGGPFVFTMTNSPASNGTSFHVTIMAKDGEFPPHTAAHLCAAKITPRAGSIGRSTSIGPITRETEIDLKRGNRIWTADFVAPPEALSNPDTAFVFSVEDYSGPAADFYVLKLRDYPPKTTAAK